jgi:hypothetical protein
MKRLLRVTNWSLNKAVCSLFIKVLETESGDKTPQNFAVIKVPLFYLQFG